MRSRLCFQGVLDSKEKQELGGRGTFHWEYLAEFQLGIVLWKHAGRAWIPWQIPSFPRGNRSRELWERVGIPAFWRDASRRLLLPVERRSSLKLILSLSGFGDATLEDMESAFPNPGSGSASMEAPPAGIP